MVCLGALRVLRGESFLRGEAGAIRIRWLVFLAVVVLGFQFGSQAARGYYGRLQLPGVLSEAIVAARRAVGGWVNRRPGDPGADPRTVLEKKLVQGAAEVGVALGPDNLLIERVAEEVTFRVQWATPLVLYVEVYRLPFEVSEALPASDPLATWLQENPRVRRRPTPSPQ